MIEKTGKWLFGLFTLLLAGASYAESSPAGSVFEQGWQAYQEHDYSRALALWLPLAEQGHAKTQNNVAMIYLSTQDESQNVMEAVRWFHRAAEQGNRSAQTSLGVLYVQGRGVKQDYNQAFEWFYRAARNGYAQAQFNLGKMYSEGLAVSQDDIKAMKWFRRAAEQGHLASEIVITELMKQGRGLRRVPYAKDTRWSKFG